MLRGAPSPVAARELFAEFVVFDRGAEAIVAHNAEFDKAFLGTVTSPVGEVPYLCAKRLAQHLIEAPAHSNQVLRYWFGGIDLDLRGKPPHRAIADVIVTGFNLQHIFDAYYAAGHPDDLDAMVAFAESPIAFPSLPFGKHRGKPIARVPESYLRWMLGQGDMDPDIAFTAKAELKRRRRAA